jgi:PAS domain S-box-containing protein
MARKHEANWESVVLGALTDAVIVASRKGVVEFMNAAAERLTGWSSSEAGGNPLESVFRILDEETHEPVENTLESLLGDEALIGVPAQLVLVARDGRELVIELVEARDIATPFEEVDRAALLVFRDATRDWRDDKRRAFLARVNAGLVSPLEGPALFAELARAAASTIADCCAVDVIDEEGNLERVAVAHAGTSQPEPPCGPILDKVLRTARLELVTQGQLTGVCVPLLARHRTLGALTILSGERRPELTQEDVRLAQTLGDCVARKADAA